MNPSQDILDLFTILHDGSIVELVKVDSQINIKIEIDYLAKMIREDHDHIFLLIDNPKNMIFIPWSDEQGSITTMEEISHLELEILGCDTENDKYIIHCHCDEKRHEYPGGDLVLDFTEFIVKDQEGKTIGLQKLRTLANNYWQKQGSDARNKH